MSITSHRLMVRLTERQENALAREAERRCVPVPEVIRRILDDWVDGAAKPHWTYDDFVQQAVDALRADGITKP